MAKYYAVRKGLTPGIYMTWDECKANTSGFSGAEFKSFKTLEEAEAFMGDNYFSGSSDDTALPEVYAFTDGSYNSTDKRYGFGGFLHYSNNEDDIEIRGNGNNPDYVDSRNVAGEVCGAIAVMKKAIDLGLPELTIFYDYEGVEKWPTRAWKANKPISQMYVLEYDKVKSRLKVNFVHVKAHSGIPGNEAADLMAKKEAGVI